MAPYINIIHNSSFVNETDKRAVRVVYFVVDWSNSFTPNGKVVKYMLFLNNHTIYEGLGTKNEFALNITNCSINFDNSPLLSDFVVLKDASNSLLLNFSVGIETSIGSLATPTASIPISCNSESLAIMNQEASKWDDSKTSYLGLLVDDHGIKMLQAAIVETWTLIFVYTAGLLTLAGKWTCWARDSNHARIVFTFFSFLFKWSRRSSSTRWLNGERVPRRPSSPWTKTLPLWRNSATSIRFAIYFE